jgi:hypothetical protein
MVAAMPMVSYADVAVNGDASRAHHAYRCVVVRCGESSVLYTHTNTQYTFCPTPLQVSHDFLAQAGHPISSITVHRQPLYITLSCARRHSLVWSMTYASFFLPHTPVNSSGLLKTCY